MPASQNAGSQNPFRSVLKRTLIIRPGAIGDAIVSLPALELLRSEYTEVWAPTVNLPLFWFGDRVRSIASTGLELVGVTDAAIPADLRSFDRIVSWYGSNRTEFQEAMKGLPVEFHSALPGEAGLAATDFYLQQVGAPLGAIPKLPFRAPKRDFIAIHPFSGSIRKNWPLENFEQLASTLSLPVEWAVTADGTHRMQGLRDVAEWLSSARLYVGNDSGITHLAAAVGTPVVALFQGNLLGVWAPRGPVVEIVDMNQATVLNLADLCVRLLIK